MPIVLDTLKQHYFIDRYNFFLLPWQVSIFVCFCLITIMVMRWWLHLSKIMMTNNSIALLIIILSQGWRNVPTHIKLHADRASDPPGELHPRRTPAGGGKVLRASWSVLANKKSSSHPPLANIYTPQNLCHIWRGSAQGLPLGSAQPQMGLQALPTKTMLPPRPRGRDR